MNRSSSVTPPLGGLGATSRCRSEGGQTGRGSCRCGILDCAGGIRTCAQRTFRRTCGILGCMDGILRCMRGIPRCGSVMPRCSAGKRFCTTGWHENRKVFHLRLTGISNCSCRILDRRSGILNCRLRILICSFGIPNSTYRILTCNSGILVFGSERGLRFLRSVLPECEIRERARSPPEVREARADSFATE